MAARFNGRVEEMLLLPRCARSTILGRARVRAEPLAPVAEPSVRATGGTADRPSIETLSCNRRNEKGQRDPPAFARGIARIQATSVLPATSSCPNVQTATLAKPSAYGCVRWDRNRRV